MKLEVDLFPIKGVVAIKTTPQKARVYLDGKFIGKTPLLKLELKPGKHRIRVALLGYYDVIRTFGVTTGKSLTLDLSLKLLPDAINPLIPKIPPKKWYERWWVWASAAGGLVAIVTAIAVPLAISAKDPVKDFNPDRIFNVP